MHLEIKKLRAFVTVVDEGSITLAAQRLNIAQPWVSVQLQRLENMMGAVLLERARGRLVRLTSKGEALLPIARSLLVSYDEAARDIKAIAERDSAKLKLGVDPITLYMPERNELIMRFMAQMPKIALEIDARSPSQLFEGLREGRFDVILTSMPAPQKDFEVLPLGQYDLELFVPKATARQYGSLAMLKGSKMLTLPDSYHPAVFARMKETLKLFRFEWITCPEQSFDALIHYSLSLGIGTLAPNLSVNFPTMARDMMVVPLGLDYPITLQWALMRRETHRSSVADRLWQMAKQSTRLQ